MISQLFVANSGFFFRLNEVFKHDLPVFFSIDICDNTEETANAAIYSEALLPQMRK